MPHLSIPFTNTKQEKTFWCWAAVAANCYNSMRPSTEPATTQCEVVTLVEKNCELNEPDSLSSALAGLGINDEQLVRPVARVVVDEFEGVSDQFDPDQNENGIAEPVCAELTFPGYAIHFVAISQVDTDSQHVWVSDPYLGGDAVEFTWDDFTKHYHYTSPDEPGPGTVTHLQRVKNKWTTMTPTPTAAKIPADIKNALLDGVRSFRSFNAADPSLQTSLQGAERALQVFTLGIPEVLIGGDGLKGATPSGWRIAVGNERGALAADIYTLPLPRKKNPLPAGTPRVACIRNGREVTRLLQAITSLTAFPLPRQLRDVAFNINLLIMPGLFTDALLLKPEEPDSGPWYVVPFYSLVDKVQLNHAYTEPELIELLRPVAEEWKKNQKKLAKQASNIY